MGCREIEEQVALPDTCMLSGYSVSKCQARACGSRCHVFGHSHISCDRQAGRVDSR